MSVVVTVPAGDDGAGDPLGRLQRFVACLDEQCRQTGLDAEIIVVDWNRPPDRGSAAERLTVSAEPFCTWRFVDVPPDVHSGLRHADVLASFPMMARNAGIRRAKGRFVLATSADIVFSTELIAHLSSRSLEAGRLYRVDCRDVDGGVPREASLEATLAYCATHQQRVHTRSGSLPVDANGRIVSPDQDIVDGQAVRLADGWHVREGDDKAGFFRWAMDRASLVVDGTDGGEIAQELEVDVEANPYDPRAWVKLDALVDEQPVSRIHLTGRMRVRVPIKTTGAARGCTVELRVVETQANSRLHLPVFERREQLGYRVHSARLRPATDQSVAEYPLSGWTNANPKSTQTIAETAEGLMVTTDPAEALYSMLYGVLEAPETGTYRFELSCLVLEGQLHVGVLKGGLEGWVKAKVDVRTDASGVRFAFTVDLERDQQIWLVISNNHPQGAGVSRFIIRGLTGSGHRARLTTPKTEESSSPSSERIRKAAKQLKMRAQRLYAEKLGPDVWRDRTSGGVHASLRALVNRLPPLLRARIVAEAPEYRAMEKAFRIADDGVRALAPLEAFTALQTTLRRQRPDNLHVNHCGEFQLMASEAWHRVRGYPEIEAFPDHIDGLLEFVAAAAGIEEELLAMPIYRPEPQAGSLAASEDEPLLRRRMAQRHVPRLDVSTVSLWASQMRWLGRPFMFNHADWGMGSVELRERTISPTVRSTR